MLTTFLRLLASLKLAVVLLVTLAVVLAWATFLEAGHGREIAQWYVYGSRWFAGLLAILGINILAATLIRFPWNKRQLGFVVTHAGLLVLLAGSIQTFLLGVEGHMTLQEGERCETILLTDRSVVTAVRSTPAGQTRTVFSFAPGPVDWPDGRAVDFGVSDGFGVQLLRFYRHARHDEQWVPDETDFQGPALKIRLSGPGGGTVSEDLLAGSMFGGEVVIGPTKYDLLPIPVPSMLEDFLDPPGADTDPAGVLSIHYDGQMQRVSISDQEGRRLPLGNDGLEVEIVKYLPNARPTMEGEFVSRGEQPKNPVLELKVHRPDQTEPLRQLAFAKQPLLNLDAVHGRVSPVKFWYHHPAVTPIPGAAFLQTPEGKLYCRPVADNAYAAAREVTEGSEIPIGGQFTVSLVRYLPRARKEVTFRPVELAAGSDGAAEAAVLVEVTAGGQSRQVWLQRNDMQFGTQPIVTQQGPMVLSFEYDQLSLGYALELQDFTRRFNPGRMGNAAFASTVRLVDPAVGVDQVHEISMNQPLTHGKFTFYQSSFQESHSGREVSVLTAAHDPGRGLKYAGSLMICLGTFLMFYMRAYLFQSVPTLFRARRTNPSEDGSGVDSGTASGREVPRPLALGQHEADVAHPASR
jgi:hypothetical protein